MTKRARFITIAAVLVATVAVGSWWLLRNRHDIERSLERASLPEAVEYRELATISPAPVVSAPKTSTAPVVEPSPVVAAAAPQGSKLPAEINLAIPFTSQAPYGSWEIPYKEFCEEASALMAARFLQGKPIASAADADAAMLAIKTFEEQEFGYWEDTNADEVVTILKKHFGIKNVVVKVNPTTDDIKAAVAAGKPVIIPAAGRQLGNPFYTPPGPLYHMLVVKGYTKEGQFITHDPGTRRGADFLYAPTTLLNAIHDWRPDGNIEAGRKVILIVG